jgi:inosine/xanthosine triphosphatase
LINIAIGTRNRPKVDACKAVLGKISEYLADDAEYRITTRSGVSGVPDMPLSLDEMMSGARNRALNVYKQVSLASNPPDYAIGMEGGFFIKYLAGNKLSFPFLQSWAYVYDGTAGYWGSSGAIQVPWNIARPILEKHQELAEVIDRISGQKDVRSGTGAIGILTRGEVIREDFFYQALIFAFAPFYNNIYSN